MPRNTHSQTSKIHAIDLFCGAGGLTCGLKKAGIKVKLGVDVDPACKYPFWYNNSTKFLCQDIRKVDHVELASHLESTATRLIAGCAPCQTFSTYNQKASKTDSRWWLLDEFVEVVRRLNPELVTMENVPGLAEHSVYDSFLKCLDDAGYKVSAQIVKCTNYGIPQQRERLVLLASKLGEISLLPPSSFRSQTKTVRDAIGGLPSLTAGAVDKQDSLHRCSTLTSKNYQRILASKPGGTWRDWSPDLVAKCHKKKTGKTYPGVYGRMSWDEPSPTITTQFFGFGNGRFGHPEQNRAISLREGAILQSFPREYRFTDPDAPIHKTTIGRLIGNAVPVRLGYVIGKSFVAHLKGLQTHSAGK